MTKFGMVTHMGRGAFLGQPGHCICTNASRGLSAAAEFLVKVTAKNLAYLLYGVVAAALVKGQLAGGGILWRPPAQLIFNHFPFR